MADKKLEDAIEFYSSLSQKDVNPTYRVGRTDQHVASEKFIWEDVRRKLKLDHAGSLLDVGCGSGVFARMLVAYASERNLKLDLVDFPKVVDLLKSELSAEGAKLDGMGFHAGAFPFDEQLNRHLGTYDRVLLYSVLHYTDRPEDLVLAAVSRLKPGGILLVGDIPNLSRRGRFLASEHGRAFEARYRGKPVEEIPSYRDHFDFVKRNRGEGAALDDIFLLGLVKRIRDGGCDAFLVPQPDELPLCLTREDLLVTKPHV